MTIDIPFNRAWIPPSDLAQAAHAVDRGHVSGAGPVGAEVEAELERLQTADRVLLTTSCTHALELSALLIDAPPGSEVIVPAFTFVSSAAAFLLHGLTPVFVDVREDTLGLDADLVEAAITPRTRAVCVVHYGGVGADPVRIRSLADRAGIVMVEDNAHGLTGRFDGRPLGSFGSLSTLSFHETKNVTCGEGGALVVNDSGLVERAEILRDKGTDRARFFRGQVDKYRWVDVGSSWVLSDLQAAILRGQLSRIEDIQARRRRIWRRYREELASWATEHGVRIPFEAAGDDHPAHLFHLRFRVPGDRDRFIAHMAALGVMVTFHYQPLHRSPAGRRLDAHPRRLPVTEDAADTLVRLPMYAQLTESEQQRVIDGVRAFRPATSAAVG